MPRQYSMETRRALTDATQARVLDAAITVLDKVGVNRLSMQAVAQEADVALRTVYNHFPSKDALVVAAYDEIAAPFFAVVAALPSEGSSQQRLHRLVEAIYGHYQRESRGLRVVLAVTGSAQFDARVAEVRAWRRDELTAILRPAVGNGELMCTLKQAVALAFLWTAFATYASLVETSGLSTGVATHLALHSLDAALFRSPAA